MEQQVRSGAQTEPFQKRDDEAFRPGIVKLDRDPESKSGNRGCEEHLVEIQSAFEQNAIGKDSRREPGQNQQEIEQFVAQAGRPHGAHHEKAGSLWWRR